MNVTREDAINAPLQRRQLEILQLVAHGYLYRQIGDMLSISPETVRKQMANVFERIGAHGRTHAVAVARREGWVQ